MNNFIFSDKFFYRLQRHIAFWVARILFLSCSFTVYAMQQTPQFENFPISSFFSHFLPSLKNSHLSIFEFEILYCYIVVYLLVPQFIIRKRYGLFAFSIAVLTAACYYANVCSAVLRLTGDMFFVVLVNTVKDFFLLGPPSVCLIFLTLKIFKTWYHKQEEKQMLLKANGDAEIQILKAQVHPHFLFNTLNNIYALNLRKSYLAGDLVLRLSEMIKYMVMECNAPLVSLDKEIKMIRDYIALEKVRYGNHLDLQVEIMEDYDKKLIAPLLMIPFVENAFKHGASKMLKQPWIKLKILVEKDMLFLYLSNSKVTTSGILQTKTGIGLKNAERRLKLLYPHESLFSIEATATVFTIQLRVPLKPVKILSEPMTEAKGTKAIKPILSG